MRGPQPWRTNRSRALRSRASSAAYRLWSELRDRRLGGFKFVREHPIGPYFVDFLCRSAKVIVEIDGGTHCTSIEIAYDHAREAFLRNEGFRIFRAGNGDIYDDIGAVCDALLAFMQEAAN